MAITVLEGARRWDRVIKDFPEFLENEADRLRQKIVEFQIGNMVDDPSGPKGRKSTFTDPRLRIVTSTLAYSLAQPVDYDLLERLIAQSRRYPRGVPRPYYQETSRSTSLGGHRVKVSFGSDQEYAHQHEFGDYYTPARPYFFPGVAEGKERAQQNMGTNWLNTRQFIRKKLHVGL